MHQEGVTTDTLKDFQEIKARFLEAENSFGV